MLLTFYLYIKVSTAKAVRNFCVQEKGKLSTIHLAVLADMSKVN